MSRMGYLVLAYSITWIAIFGYTLVLGSRQTKLDREIAVLEEAMGQLHK